MSLGRKSKFSNATPLGRSTGAADFVYAEDMRNVVGRIVVEAQLRFLDEFFAIAELGGASGTDLGARCRLSGSDAIGTHDALLNLGKNLAPLVFGDAEGAGDHAVAAAHATTFFVNDGAGRGLVQSTDGTNGGACRIFTVHAHPAHELIVLGEDRCEFVVRGYLLSGDLSSYGNLFCCAHPTSHCLQPIQWLRHRGWLYS